MALFYFDGFDNYFASKWNSTGASDNDCDILLNTGLVQWSNLTMGSNLVTGRNGTGKCIQICGVYQTFSVGFSEAYFGFATLATGTTISYSINIQDGASGATHCTVVIDPTNGMIHLKDSTGTQVSSSNANAINCNAWCFVEVHVKIGSGTSGKLEVQVNGQLVISNTSMSTQSGSATTFNRLQWLGGVSATQWYFDDFRINDTSTGAGSYPCNSWMGDLRCVTLFPTGNHSVAWTPQSETNWEMVNNPGTSALGTTYNSTLTPGDTDLFLMQALPNIINYIVGVQVKGAYQQADSSTHTVKNALSISSTTYTGTTWTLTNSWNYFTDIWVVNPNTGLSWTYNDVINMFAGYVDVS